MDLTSRYLGLVVVPGEFITRIEVEEFASQMRGRRVGREGTREMRAAQELDGQNVGVV